MSDKSTYLANASVNWLRGTAMPTAPSTVYLALYTTLPAADNTGGTEVSTSGTAYARQAITLSAASAGATANTVAVTFPVATANFGTIVGVTIMDSGTAGAGNQLYRKAITSIAINTSDQFVVAIGALTLTEA